MAQVFIAYSREEADCMQMLREELKKEDVSVWTDEDLSRSDNDWVDTIQHALDEASCVVVLFSPTAKKSRWVKGELAYAAEEKRRIYCVHAKGAKKDAVWLPWHTASFFDLRPKGTGKWNMSEVAALVADLKRNC